MLFTETCWFQSHKSRTTG